MKHFKLILIAGLFLVGLSSCKKEMTFNADTSTWATDSTVCISLTNSKSAKEFRADWGDGSSTIEAVDVSGAYGECHEYTVAGTYTITLTAKNFKPTTKMIIVQ